MEIRLPFPPSVNEMFGNNKTGNGKGRYRTALYEDWLFEAGLQINHQKPGQFKQRAIVMIDLDDRRQGDCGNREKAVTDLLVTHKVLRGDQKKYVKRVSIGWEKVEGCKVKLLGAE